MVSGAALLWLGLLAACVGHLEGRTTIEKSEMCTLMYSLIRGCCS